MILKAEAYKIIKKKILSCKYLPNSFLNEEMLEEELNMSRTPIRDALGRLEQEHLVKIRPKKGFVITGIKKEEIEKIYELRMLIEPYALKKYGCKIEKKVLREFETFCEKTYETSSPARIFTNDDKLHRLFLKATGNQYLIYLYNNLYNQLNRLRVLSGYDKKSRLEESNNEHLAIIRFCLTGNWARAAKALETHLVRAKEAAYSLKLKS
jgi:DNA-binding GntR family transcriptional regulator